MLKQSLLLLLVLLYQVQLVLNPVVPTAFHIGVPTSHLSFHLSSWLSFLSSAVPVQLLLVVAFSCRCSHFCCSLMLSPKLPLVFPHIYLFLWPAFLMFLLFPVLFIQLFPLKLLLCSSHLSSYISPRFSFSSQCNSFKCSHFCYFSLKFLHFFPSTYFSDFLSIVFLVLFPDLFLQLAVLLTKVFPLLQLLSQLSLHFSSHSFCLLLYLGLFQCCSRLLS